MVNPIELGKLPDVTFLTYDPNLKYLWQHNWVLIASLGDPKTWKGTEYIETAVSRQMKGGDQDGLAGCLIDFNVLQEILYKRPSGEYDGLNFTHHLQSMLLADSNSIVGKTVVLD